MEAVFVGDMMPTIDLPCLPGHVFRWAHPFHAFEHAVKVALVVEAHLESDFAHAEFRLVEQAFRFVDAELVDVTLEIAAVRLLYGGGNAALAGSGAVGHLFQCKVGVVEVVVDVVEEINRVVSRVFNVNRFVGDGNRGALGSCQCVPQIMEKAQEGNNGQLNTEERPTQCCIVAPKSNGVDLEGALNAQLWSIGGTDVQVEDIAHVGVRHIVGRDVVTVAPPIGYLELVDVETILFSLGRNVDVAVVADFGGGCCTLLIGVGREKGDAQAFGTGAFHLQAYLVAAAQVHWGVVVGRDAQSNVRAQKALFQNVVEVDEAVGDIGTTDLGMAIDHAVGVQHKLVALVVGEQVDLVGADIVGVCTNQQQCC